MARASSVRKFAWLVVGAAALAAASASAQVSKATPAPVVKRPFKLAPRAADTLSPAELTKVRALLATNIAKLRKDADVKAFVTGGKALGGAATAAYQVEAARLVSGKPVSSASGVTAGSGITQRPPTYAIKSGEVTASSSSAACDGTVSLSLTLENRGAKYNDVTRPKILLRLVRGDKEIGETWTDIPAMPANGTATIPIPALRHQLPNPAGGCVGGDAVIHPSFVGVAALSDYRIKLDFGSTGAEATLLTGPFVDVSTNDDCSGFRCPSGACSLYCPPCPNGYETNASGGCSQKVMGF